MTLPPAGSDDAGGMSSGESACCDCSIIVNKKHGMADKGAIGVEEGRKDAIVTERTFQSAFEFSDCLLSWTESSLFI